MTGYHSYTETDIEDALREGHTLRVESEYDRSVRSYRTMIVDERGWQVGESSYDGTKADRAAAVARFERFLAGAQADADIDAGRYSADDAALDAAFGNG